MATKASDLIKEAESFYAQSLTPESTKEIRNRLETGIPQALGLLANIIMCGYLNRWNEAGKDASLAHAQKIVDLALYLAPDEPTAHYAQAFIYRAGGHHEEAYESFVLSLQHNPGSVRTRAQVAAESLYLGRFDEALREIDLAIAAAAGNPALGMFQWIRGRTLFFMGRDDKGRYDEAILCLRESIGSWKNLWYNRLYLVSALAHRGRIEEAEAALAEFREEFDGYDTIEDVKTAEGTNPNDNPAVVEGRKAFHAGLAMVGIK